MQLPSFHPFSAPCQISSQECAIIGEDEHLCAAASRYYVFAAPDNGSVSFSHLYVTLFWDIGNCHPKVLHLQVSALLQSPGHPFEEPLRLSGLHSGTYFLRAEEIIYIEADNNNCCALFI